MARFRIEFHPSAVDEAEGALDWYAARSPAAAKAFLHELDHALSQIVEAPHRWPRYSQDVWRFQFRRFPFTLFYRATEDTVQILAIAAAGAASSAARARAPQIVFTPIS